MRYVNTLVVRGILSDNDIANKIDSVLNRLKNTYGTQCDKITPMEVQVYRDDVYQRGFIVDGNFVAQETVKIQSGVSDRVPSFWTAKLSVVVNDLTLHNELKEIQHGDSEVFTAHS